MMILLLLTLLSIFCIHKFLVQSRVPPRFPPGPRSRFAIFDAILSSKTLRDLRAKYGDIVGVTHGNSWTVYVCSFDLIQEVSSSLEFAGKTQTPLANLLRGGEIRRDNIASGPGVVRGQGQNWVEQRRFVLHTLRDLGLGKKSMEELVGEEVQNFCAHLAATNGQPMDVSSILSMAVLNSLWHLSVGKRLDYDDKKLAEIVNLAHQLTRETRPTFLTASVANKIVAEIICRLNLPNQKFKSYKGMRELIAEEIKGHKATYQEDNFRDFLDCYLNEMRNKFKQNKMSSFLGATGDLNLINVLLDFFVAGNDTTSNTLLWGFVFLLKNPYVMEKVQNELDQVTGRSRFPRISDRVNTPFTEAVIHEIQRKANFTPKIFHLALADKSIQDGRFFIPKGTQVLLNLEGLMQDSKEFPEPHKFDPSRFINNEGKFVPHPMVIPFGVGKRRCIGEPLARTSLYMFLAGILSQFNLQKSHPSDHITERAHVGIFSKPYPFKIRFVQR